MIRPTIEVSLNGLRAPDAVVGNRLLIDQNEPAGFAVRVNVTRFVSMAFAAFQVVNLVWMYVSYGRWTHDHLVAVAVIIMLLAFVATRRLYENKIFSAFFFFILIYAGVFSSAVPDRGGINTSLLHFIIVSPIIAGFVAGWRASVVYAALGMIALPILYVVAAGPPDAWPAMDESREVRRLAQGLFGLMTTGMIGAFFSANTFRGFRLLETQNAELRAARDQAEASAEAREAFLSVLSHELRTPLHQIMLANDLLRRNADEALNDEIETAAQNLYDRLGDLIEYVELRSAKPHPAPETVGLPVLAARIQNAVRPYRRAPMTIETPQEAQPKLHCESRRLVRAAVEVIRNAHEALGVSAVHVRIHLQMQHLADAIHIDVEDDGVGMSDDQIGKALQPFVQSSSSLAREKMGFGIGLAFADELVRSVGGSLTIARRAERGTRVRLVVPATPIVR